jgi:hypothetical protein
MNRPRLIRGLRIAWSVAWGIVCLLVCLMWNRSIRYVDVIDGFSSSGDFVSILSVNGGVEFTGGPNLWALLRVTNWGNIEDELTVKLDEYYNIAKSMGQLRIPLDYPRLNQLDTEIEGLRTAGEGLAVSKETHLLAEPSNAIVRSFSYVDSRNCTTLVIPYWFLVIFSIAQTAAPWIRWSSKYSLRTLLIATTLVAVVLGLFVWVGHQQR